LYNPDKECTGQGVGREAIEVVITQPGNRKVGRKLIKVVVIQPGDKTRQKLEGT